MKLADRVALVTGGGRGIGRAICLALAREGADVLVGDLDREGATKVAREIEAIGRRGLALEMDVTQSSQVNQAVQRGIQEMGRIDILVNNAGWDKLQLFVQNSEELWQRLIAINLLGPIICTRAVLDGMIERKRGKIVNISSDAGRAGSTGEAVYSAAKGGIIAFSKTMAREMARYNINVNCICPGITDTPLLAEITSQEWGKRVIDAIVQATPLRRLARPEEIASAVVFLASDDASFITGQTLSISGGLTMM
ncbi:MAG: glucose 1-dehydrogenase [Chloroflexi bacterium]|nr:glucose 1-dehydrogenase [Chloroflexota bacterium]